MQGARDDRAVIQIVPLGTHESQEVLKSAPSMSSPVELEYFVLDYAPHPLRDQTVNIAIAAFAVGEEDFGEVRFLGNWLPVLKLDPQADVEALDSFAKEVTLHFQTRQNRDRIVQLMKDSFSNVIQISTIRHCTSSDPLALVEDLTKEYLSA